MLFFLSLSYHKVLVCLSGRGEFCHRRGPRVRYYDEDHWVPRGRANHEHLDYCARHLQTKVILSSPFFLFFSFSFALLTQTRFHLCVGVGLRSCELIPHVESGFTGECSSLGMGYVSLPDATLVKVY